MKKKILPAVVLLLPCLLPCTTWGAAQSEDELAALLQTPSTPFPEAATLPDYMLSRPVPLTGAEKESLNMANEWAKKYAKPMLLGNGKLVWMYGVSRPTIVGAPMQVCDVELQPGEQINEILVGDTARWHVEIGRAGHSSGNVPHVFVKPLDSGLETTAVITTDRRVYHLRLISQSKRYTPYVGFLYPEDQFRQSSPLVSRRDSLPLDGTGVAQGGVHDLSNLSFNYSIRGDAKWRPEQVYDDGKQTFLRLPPSTQNMPILLARDSRSNDLLVNYRVQGTTFTVDGVFDHLVLLLGVGTDQEVVDVRRNHG